MNTMDLDGKTIIIGITGSVACYKTLELIRLLRQQGARVQVVMTAAAQTFIQPLLCEAISGQTVICDTTVQQSAMTHIHPSRHADLILICPATANTLAHLAQGIANNALTALCLARGHCPLWVAPAMNKEMWQHPATQRNIHQLQQDHVRVIGPQHGEQACGEIGYGRMVEPADLCAAIVGAFQPQVLQGKRVLITAGGTQEPIDPVRIITNRSSGKMGYALAQAAVEAGATVHLVSTNPQLTVPFGVSVEYVRQAREMNTTVLAQAATYDYFIAVAAVADCYVSNAASHKLKNTNQYGYQLEFAPNPDILANVARLPQPPYCVGFAAETTDIQAHALQKLQRKQIPMIVANQANQVLEQDQTALLVYTQNGHHYSIAQQSKRCAARQLIQLIAEQSL